MKIMKKCAIYIAAFYMSACATGAQMDGMSTSGNEYSYSDALKENVAVLSVSGGEETNPFLTSEISSEAFQEALKQSLKSQGLLSESGKYKLKVEILNVDQPVFGMDFTVTTHVKYVLVDAVTSVVIFDETIAAPHTAPFGDSFSAVKRLRLANEGSGKKNIEMFLEKLSKMKNIENGVSLAN